MNNKITELQPNALWENFAKICQIPHQTKKEQQLARFLENFAKELSLEVIVDSVRNVIIKKAATKNMENCKTVVLQSHMDMVCQKKPELKHDFDQDPIEPYIAGDWVKANGTTLGADNGIGVAAMMAILQANDISHGPLEMLFTVDEEEDFTGAVNLKPGLLNAEILLNLDSEIEGDVYIGSAGGMNTIIDIPYIKYPLEDDVLSFEICVSGLNGGHSGVEINRQYGNAIKILTRILWETNKKFEINLAKISGGTYFTAIPKEAAATIAIQKKDKDNIIKLIKELTQTITHELAENAPNLTISINERDKVEDVLAKDDQSQLLNTLYACPHGVLAMSKTVPNLVETSSNLATITAKSNHIEILTSQRSMLDSLKHDAANMIRSTFELIGAKVKHEHEYPGWEADKDSEILRVLQKVHLEKFNKPVNVKAIHAGLECGLFKTAYPKLDMISFGPTLENVHTYEERVNIKSVETFWDFLLATLSAIPKNK